MAKKSRTTTTEFIPYAPDTWNKYQLEAHRADTLDAAFHAASCLAVGWYRRPVTIDWQITEGNNARYMIRPAEVAPLDGWHPCYTVARAEEK